MAKLNTKIPSTNSGFTLIEIMMVSVLAIFVVAASYLFWQLFIESFYSSFDEGKELTAANQSLSTISREIREMRASQTGAYPLTAINDQELAFYLDVDNDGEAEHVRYWLDNQTLKKSIIEPSGDPIIYDSGTESTQILVSTVHNQADPLFYYYNEDWPQDQINNPLILADRLLDTRLITIQLKIGYTNVQDEDPVEVSTSVALRGLKTNL